MGLREIRELEKIGLNKLARITDMSPSYISQLERGMKVNPSKDTMEKISKALNRSVQEVFFEKDDLDLDQNESIKYMLG